MLSLEKDVFHIFAFRVSHQGGFAAGWEWNLFCMEITLWFKEIMK